MTVLVRSSSNLPDQNKPIEDLTTLIRLQGIYLCMYCCVASHGKVSAKFKTATVAFCFCYNFFCDEVLGIRKLYLKVAGLISGKVI
jgi:hypothetical protein